MKLNVSSTNHEYKSQWIELKVNQSDFNGALDKVKYLYRVLANAQYLDTEHSGVERFLSAGRAMFGVTHGLLIRRLSQQVGEVVAVGIDEEQYYVGQHLNIENSFTSEVLDKKEPVVSRKIASLSGYRANSVYNDVEVNTYLGAVVEPSRGSHLAVCFFSPSYQSEEFVEEDTEILKLLAEGLASMLDIQKAQAQRKLTDQAMFALGSVKTLDEYLQQARLPEVYGVPARVVEVLQKRIGHAPLSIGHVSEELNLSKRTLQRRLQQQDISFAELRDQVRFHYSIDYLVKQHLSIDSISASLDFSDRTSFTNAFKRWTGLSPSTFRKLFRDYV